MSCDIFSGSCGECPSGVGDCPRFIRRRTGEDPLKDPQDLAQDGVVQQLEGQQIVNRFYTHIEKSLAIMQARH